MKHFFSVVSTIGLKYVNTEVNLKIYTEQRAAIRKKHTPFREYLHKKFDIGRKLSN